MPTAPTLIEKLQAAMIEWYNANLVKNKAQTDERKSGEKAAKLFTDMGRNSAFPVEVNDSLYLEADFVTVDSEEVDPKKLFESNPTAFWQLVTIPKGNLEAMIGQKDAMKFMRPVKKTAFKISKVKGKIPNEG